MSESTPKRLAFFLTALLSIIVILMFLLINSLENKNNFWLMVSIVIIVFVVLQYFILNFALEKYIYNRIKLIYKTIHRQKLKKDDKKELLANTRGDVIEKVNIEVEKWANERKQEIEELKKMEVYRREFLGNVSHELKTPIFNIQGFVLTLLDGGINDKAINVNFLQKTQKNIERMITIVEDLEVISRFEAGEISPVFTNFSIVSLAREVLDFLEPKANERKIKLCFATDYIDDMVVYADKEKIRTVLNNLVENSIKYGVQEGRTKLSFYDMDENYLIEVSDDGVGIDAKHIPRLFERFYRIDKHRSRTEGGSGLGLAIVKHIIEAHSQTINLRSALGVGSTFSFTLKKA